MHSDARACIDRLRLQPIPGEGGWFRETWRSPGVVRGGMLAGLPEDRPAGTAILALFCDDPAGFSALHRLPIPEVWHFCGGDPLRLLLLHADAAPEQVLLGADLVRAQVSQVVVPAGTWMGARLVENGRFALVGCTMAPGFVEGDCELGRRSTLMDTYPEQRAEIARLTRAD